MRRVFAFALVSVAVAAGALAPAGASADSLESGLWYFDRGNVQVAHDAGFDGSGVTVAVIDSQVNPDAIGLRGADLQVREDSFCFDESGKPYPAVSADYALAGHGTSVASMIVGTGEAPAGGVPIKGVAPGARLLYYNVAVPEADADAVGEPGLSCALENGEQVDEDGQFAMGLAISAAVDDGADIISISMNGSIPVDEAVAKAYAAGVIVVAGLSNDSGFAGWPAGLNGVIAVQAFDSTGSIASSKSGSPNNSDDVKVAAPGVGVITQGSAESWEEQELGSGTSLATPIVSGFLAVAMQKYPDATGNQLIQSLIHNTGTGGEHEPEWNSSTGYGAASLTGLLQVNPSKYSDTNPLFDPDSPNAPTGRMVAEAARELDKASPEPSATATVPSVPQTESSVWVPWLVGGSVTAVLVVGGVILAVVLTRSSQKQKVEEGANYDR